MHIDVHADDAVGVGNGSISQKHCVDGAEYHRRGADAEGKRDDDDRSEAGSMKQRADAVTNIAPEVGERYEPCRPDGGWFVECRVHTVE